MQLFTTYGVQSSVPPKTVVAVIDKGNTAGTYSFTFINDSYYSFTTGAVIPEGNLHRTNIVDIIGDTIILDNRTKVSRVSFWNGETFLGFYSHIGTTFAERLGEIPADGVITPPANATRFAFDGHINNSGYVYFQSDATFASLVATYPAVPQKVTFFDEYPNGTQIGNVVEVAGPIGQYSFTFFENSRSDINGITSDSNWTTSNIVPIINNSIILPDDTSNLTRINYYNGSTYVSNQNVLGSSVVASIPSGVTHFAISGYKPPGGVNNGNVTSAELQANIISYSSGLAQTVDPPATYKIRQLVFEE